jgi:hypothetical protein
MMWSFLWQVRFPWSMSLTRCSVKIKRFINWVLRHWRWWFTRFFFYHTMFQSQCKRIHTSVIITVITTCALSLFIRYLWLSTLLSRTVTSIFNGFSPWHSYFLLLSIVLLF